MSFRLRVGYMEILVHKNILTLCAAFDS